MEFTREAFDSTAEAYAKVEIFKDAVLDRAKLYCVMHSETDRNVPGPHIFRRNSGYYAEVTGVQDMLISTSKPPVTIRYIDQQGRGSWQSFQIPYDFIFGVPTEEESDYIKLIQLQEKIARRNQS